MSTIGHIGNIMQLVPRGLARLGVAIHARDTGDTNAEVRLRAKHRSLPEALGRDVRRTRSTHASSSSFLGKARTRNFEFDAVGADALPFEHRRRQLFDAPAIRHQFQSEFDASPHPYMLLDPGPAYTSSTSMMLTRQQLLLSAVMSLESRF